jgi:uncharacterized protein YqeY
LLQYKKSLETSLLHQRIVEDMKSAMKAKDKEGLKAIRMILGAIKQREVDERIELVDEQVLYSYLSTKAKSS